MKLRHFLLAGTGIVIVIIVAGMIYTAHFANSVNSTQAHTAPGAAIPTGTPIPSSGLTTFQIVPAQTTAAYSVYENLVFQNKPNNDAIGTTHSVQGSFKIKSGASPLVAGMNIQVDLRTLQSDSVEARWLHTAKLPANQYLSLCNFRLSQHAGLTGELY